MNPIVSGLINRTMKGTMNAINIMHFSILILNRKTGRLIIVNTKKGNPMERFMRLPNVAHNIDRNGF
jgi:hypothetical protein